MSQITTNFWKEYEDLDELERLKKVEFIAKSIDSYKDVEDKNIRLKALTSLINSYFEDILEYSRRSNGND